MIYIFSSYNEEYLLFLTVATLLFFVFEVNYVLLIYKDTIKKLFESSVALYAVTICAVLKKISLSMRYSIVNLNNADVIFMVSSIVIIILSIICIKKLNEKIVLSAVMPIILMLVFINNVMFLFMLTFSVFFYILRAVNLTLSEKKKRENKLDVGCFRPLLYSMKIGVMFYNNRGEILICNPKIIYLTRKINGRFYNDARKNRDVWLKNKIREVDGKIYKAVTNDRKNYHELVLYDITEEMSLNGQIKENNEKIAEENESVLKALRDAEKIGKITFERKVFHKIHDYMGSKLCVIERMIKENPNRDINELISVISELKIPVHNAELSAKKEIEELNEELLKIDMNINFSGYFNKNAQTSADVIAIIRESVINAVRHSESDTIYIYSDEKTLVIENSIDTKTEITEGNGMRIIKKKAESMGAKCAFEISDKFIVKISYGEAWNVVK